MTDKSRLTYAELRALSLREQMNVLHDALDPACTKNEATLDVWATPAPDGKSIVAVEIRSSLPPSPEGEQRGHRMTLEVGPHRSGFVCTWRGDADYRLTDELAVVTDGLGFTGDGPLVVGLGHLGEVAESVGIGLEVLKRSSLRDWNVANGKYAMYARAIVSALGGTLRTVDELRASPEWAKFERSPERATYELDDNDSAFEDAHPSDTTILHGGVLLWSEHGERCLAEYARYLDDPESFRAAHDSTDDGDPDLLGDDDDYLDEDDDMEDIPVDAARPSRARTADLDEDEDDDEDLDGDPPPRRGRTKSSFGGRRWLTSREASLLIGKAESYFYGRKHVGADMPPVRRSRDGRVFDREVVLRWAADRRGSSPHMLDSRQASRLLGYSSRWLEGQRHRRRPTPPHSVVVKNGSKRIMYRRVDVLAWKREQEAGQQTLPGVA